MEKLGLGKIIFGSFVFIIGFIFFSPTNTKAATYYLGTSPTTSFTYQVWNQYLGTFLEVTTSMKIASGTEYCATKSAHVPTMAELVQVGCSQNLSSTTYPLNNSGQYLTTDKTPTGGGYYWRMTPTFSSVGSYCPTWSLQATPPSSAYTIICVNNTSSQYVTVTGTYYGYSDQLFITSQATATASSSSSSTMDPQQIKIFTILLLLIAGVLLVDFLRRYFAKDKNNKSY